jgi:hypothetical protein
LQRAIHNEGLGHSAYVSASNVVDGLPAAIFEIRPLMDAAALVTSADSSAAEALIQQAIIVAEMLQYAATCAREVAARVVLMEVDASGADLSSLAPMDVSLLAGVVWPDETLWPSGTDCDLLRARSAEIAPGIYRVAQGNERDRSDLVIQ